MQQFGNMGGFGNAAGGHDIVVDMPVVDGNEVACPICTFMNPPG